MAEANGIIIMLSLSDLANIKISDEDLVIILSNLLDNAIEACMNLNEESRIIKFQCIWQNDELNIIIKNPMTGKLKTINDYPVSTKQNPEEHGIGLQNVEEAIRKYNGECSYSSNGGFFSYSIIIRA
ncbi:MAG: ATP-binding protein [Lachnospiraceae bacterium]|nr:ATP-binding protein [Lachnospiraceae bacterium]